MSRITLSALLVLAACSSRPPAATTPCAPAPTVAAGASAPSGELQMRKYFLVLLRRGPAWTPEKTPETKKLFEGHMANIAAMANTGKLLIAGPIDADAADRDAVAGIFLFDVPTREEVDAMLVGDPAIVAKRLVPEVLSWFGPANITYPGLPKPK